MKKIVIIAVLVISILAMSSAYAVWNDSVSTSVSAYGATTKLNYIGRSNPSGIEYTQQGGALSESNPYVYIEETTTSPLYTNSSNGNFTITYTIKNTGTAPVDFDGITVSDLALATNTSGYFAGIINYLIVSGTDIYYTLDINGDTLNHTVNVYDLYSNTEEYISFASVDNTLAAGDSCTLTVLFDRSDGWNYYLYLRIVETLEYSTYY